MILQKNEIGTRKDINGEDKPIFGFDVPKILEPYIISTTIEGKHYEATLKEIPLDVIAELLPEYPELREELSVEKYKLEIVIYNEGLTSSLEDILENNSLYKIAWKGTNTVKRTSVAVNEMASGLGLTEEQVDKMFIDANKVII